MADANENTPTPEENVITPTPVTPEASVSETPQAPEAATEAPVDTPEQVEAPEEPIALPAPVQPKDKAGMNRLARLVFELILVATVVALGLWGYGLQTKNNDLKKQVDTLNSNPVIVEQKKTAELVTKVGALMQLPKDETPQAALVSDAEALKKQYPFFSEVQNQDQVLFYVKAGKVIVYRPSTNKVVQSGPLSVNQAAPATNVKR